MRLLCDAMLGRLAKDLRLLGHDAALAVPSEPDDAVRARAAAEGRRLLTRDADLAARCPGALRLASDDPAAQLREAVAALGLRWDEAAFVTRCSLCNVALEPAPPGMAVPPGAAGDLWSCPACRRVYWQGAHVADLRRRLRAALP